MHKSTVFIIEDHHSVMDAVTALLESSGYRAKRFSRHETFFKQRILAKEGCILVDLTAPGMNATQFMRRLRANGCLLPVISATCSISADLVREFQNFGVHAILKKPLDALELLEAVQQATDLSSFAAFCGALSCLSAAT